MFEVRPLRMEVDVAIIGAGIAGLGAALKAKHLGRQAVIFEASNKTGGLLDNFEVNGFRFDQAVHLSFTKIPLVREIFSETPILEHPATSHCFEECIWLKHPVQNNLFPLPAAERVSLIKSFLERPESPAKSDYGSWLIYQYGEEIANRYPIKYTRKYWATEAEQLSTTWIGERVRRSNVDEILFGAFTPNTEHHYYANTMKYPEKGGYKAFINNLISNTDIRLNDACDRIYPNEKLVILKSGQEVRYNTLVCSAPLNRIGQICVNCPSDIQFACEQLEATSIDLVSIGFADERVDKLWFYIYDEDIWASRAHSPSVKSKYNAPPGTSSLQFEIYSRGRDPKYTADATIKNTMYAIQKMGIGKEEEIIALDHRRVPYGNVIFELGMEENRELVLDWCKSVGINMCGRFGKWDYYWSDQSLMSGYTALN